MLLWGPKLLTSLSDRVGRRIPTMMPWGPKLLTSRSKAHGAQDTFVPAVYMRLQPMLRPLFAKNGGRRSKPKVWLAIIGEAGEHFGEPAEHRATTLSSLAGTFAVFP
jgi:hypothetical protein